MADQQRIQAPFGDIFFVSTPTIDKLSQQLYIEQKQRQAKQQQEDAMLEAGIQKELGKVRSVDTPEVIKAYSDYKRGKMELLRNKELQKDPLAFNQAQQKILQDYQRVFATANKSAELKDMQKQLAEDRIKNPNAYADDFGERMATLMNTPISGVGQHEVYGDLTNWDNYRYQGSNTDWSKIVNDAAGKKSKIAGAPTMLPGGLQMSTPIYEYGNTPAQIKDNILGAMAVHQTGRDAAYTWDHIPEAEVEKTIKDYQSIPKEDWQNLGLKEPQDIRSKNPDSKTENLATYLAMKRFIANRPRLVENKLQDNKKAISDYEFAQKKILEGIEFGHKKELKQDEQNKVNSWIVNYWDKRISEATAKPPVDIPGPKTPTLTNKMGYEVNPDQIMMEALKIAGQYPNRVYVTGDKKLLPIFYQYKEVLDPETGKKVGTEIDTDEYGNPKIDEDYSKPQALDQAYLSMGYKGQTKKDLGGTMQGVYKGPKNEPPKSTSSNTSSSDWRTRAKKIQ